MKPGMNVAASPMQAVMPNVGSIRSLWAQCPLTELCCFLMGPNSYRKVVKFPKNLDLSMF